MPHRSRPPQGLLLLRADRAAPPALVRAARRSIARLPRRILADSYFHTFWLPAPAARAKSPARHPLERLVEHLASLAAPGPWCAGLEWWVGRAHTDALPIGFHFDQDVKARRGFRNPRLSSVFFFNRVRGGQLAVTDQVAGPGGAPRPAVARALEVVDPRPNRFVVFPGDLLHGVLDERGRPPGPIRGPGRGRLRVTLVVNFWERRPTAVPELEEALRRGRGSRRPRGAGRSPRRPLPQGERAGPAPSLPFERRAPFAASVPDAVLKPEKKR